MRANEYNLPLAHSPQSLAGSNHAAHPITARECTPGRGSTLRLLGLGLGLVLGGPLALQAAETEEDLRSTLISVDFPDENRATIIRNVASLFELNLSIPVELPNNKISLKLRRVTWRQIIREALASTGYTLEEHDNIPRIVKEDDPRTAIGHIETVAQFLASENLHDRQIIARLSHPDAPPLTPEQRQILADYALDPRQTAEKALAALNKATPEGSWQRTAEKERQIVGTWDYEINDALPFRGTFTCHADGRWEERLVLTATGIDDPPPIELHGFWAWDAASSALRTFVVTSTQPRYFRPGHAGSMRVVAVDGETLVFRVGTNETVYRATREPRGK